MQGLSGSGVRGGKTRDSLFVKSRVSSSLPSHQLLIAKNERMLLLYSSLFLVADRTLLLSCVRRRHGISLMVTMRDSLLHNHRRRSRNRCSTKCQSRQTDSRHSFFVPTHRTSRRRCTFTPSSFFPRDDRTSNLTRLFSHNQPCSATTACAGATEDCLIVAPAVAGTCVDTAIDVRPSFPHKFDLVLTPFSSASSLCRPQYSLCFDGDVRCGCMHSSGWRCSTFPSAQAHRGSTNSDVLLAGVWKYWRCVRCRTHLHRIYRHGYLRRYYDRRAYLNFYLSDNRS